MKERCLACIVEQSFLRRGSIEMDVCAPPLSGNACRDVIVFYFYWPAIKRCGDAMAEIQAMPRGFVPWFVLFPIKNDF
jgi:hypothetical protein